MFPVNHLSLVVTSLASLTDCSLLIQGVAVSKNSINSNFQNEPKRKTFLVKMNLIFCNEIKTQPRTQACSRYPSYQRRLGTD